MVLEDGKLADPKQIYSNGCKQAMLIQLAVIVRAVAIYITVLSVALLIDCSWWFVMSWKAKRRQRQLDVDKWNKEQNEMLQQGHTSTV